MAPHRRTASERFWAHVDKRGPDECWLWKGGQQRYPKIRLDPYGAEELAHRYSYQMAHGEIPGGMVVRHRCDRSRCVNPAHLDVGTQADNIADKCVKNRQARGSGQALAKLTEARATAVIHDYNQGATIRALAARERVAVTTIERILSGVSWAHVGVSKQRVYTRAGAGHFGAKLSTEDVRTIRTIYAGRRGESAALARRFMVSKTTIGRILRGLIWQDTAPSCGAGFSSSRSQV